MAAGTSCQQHFVMTHFGVVTPPPPTPSRKGRGFGARLPLPLREGAGGRGRAVKVLGGSRHAALRGV
jgi:hypothetical protein